MLSLSITLSPDCAERNNLLSQTLALKATVMPKWRKIFEAEDSDFGGWA